MQLRIIVGALAIAALVSCLDTRAQSNVYRWTDKDGKVYYSDTPPPSDAKSSSQKRVGGGYVEQENLPYATQMAMKRNPVSLFTGADCGDPCSQGRELLSKRGIPFAERDAQGNPADAEALKKLVGGLEVSTLVIGESKIKGFESEQWQSALDGAGYPRTRLPGQAPAVRAPAKAATETAKAPEASEPEPKAQ
ncbi:MAG: glutaredoxin family protein [Usitatibacter sp.]